MRKTKKTKLHVAREILRALQSQELRIVRGGMDEMSDRCTDKDSGGEVCCI